MPGPTRINLAEAIRGPWEHVVITTFGLDLAFFERAILPQINQARGRLILADADQLLAHQASAARGRMVRHLNRSYVAAGISVPGAAHAKVILLLGQSHGRLLVGSGNLRLTGWGAAGEMFTRYDVSDGDQASLPAFMQVRELLNGLATSRALDDFAAAYLDQIWSRTPWLSSASADAHSEPLVHNLIRPILDQFEDALRERGQVAELLILAPFHDPDCVATALLIERTRPTTAALLVQEGRTSVDPKALARLMRRFQQLVIRPFGPKGDHGQYVHAKLIVAKQGRASVCLQGSANLSLSALMRTAAEGNFEVANLLVGKPDAHASLLSELWVGDPIVDPDSLDVQIQVDELVFEPGKVRVLEAHWDGELLRIRIAGAFRRTSSLWVRLGEALVEGEVVELEDDPIRTGQRRLTVRLPDDVIELFSRAVPLAIFTGGGTPPAKIADEDLSEPIFCVNQPSLMEQLDARPASIRLRDVGLLSLDDDRQLQELLRALQGTMVYDKRTLVEAHPPPNIVEEEPDDEQLLIAYADVDYEALRAIPKLRQYRQALTAGASVGLMPSDIQLALRSITDAFGAIVGRAPRESKRVTFSSSWSAQEDDSNPVGDPSLLQQDLQEETMESEEQSEEAAELEETTERRWSEEARLRVHWRNFIHRYLRGLRSPAWRQLVGTAVLSGNYEIFAHILQRLHRQPWQNFDFMEFLIQAQTATHGFVWGTFEEADGWLAELSGGDRRHVVKAFGERHLAVRLLVDLAGCGALTLAGEFDESDQLIDERKSIRDVARAVLLHHAWQRLISEEENLIRDATAVAADLAVGGDFGYWLEAPTAERLLGELSQLVDYTTTAEFQRDVAKLVGIAPLRVQVRKVMLGPEGKQTPTHEVEVAELDRIDLQTALQIMARLSHVSEAPKYRVRAGKSRLVREAETGEMVWVPDLYGENEALRELPAVERPWDEVLAALQSMAEAAKAEAVA